MPDFITKENIVTADFLQGALLLVDKPGGWTSFDVVNKIRGALRRRYQIKNIKVGHAGTLDPMATGLLMICTGKWTTKLSEFQGMDKEYTGTITLGATTPSYDKETPVENEKPFTHLSETDIRGAVKEFIGEIEQVPPLFSAIKVDGRALYKSARKGQEVEVPSRKVKVHAFDIVSVELPLIHFRVICSKGTYIRSLAHDLGQRLGCGAYLTALRRTRIGECRVEDAWTLDRLISDLHADSGTSDK